MTTLRSLFLILVALTLGAPSSHAVAWAVSFRQYDGSDAPRQVEFVPAVNSLVGFNSSKQVTNVTIGSGLSLTSGVLSANAIGAGAITNSNLAHSTITLGNSTLTLGGTTTGISGLTQVGVTQGLFSVRAGSNTGLGGPYVALLTDPSDITGWVEQVNASGGLSWFRYNLGVPTTIANLTPSGNFTVAGSLGGSNLSGTNTGDQNTFANIVVGSTTIMPGSTNGTLTLVAGSNVTLTPSGTGNRTITIAASGGGGGSETYTGTGNVVKDTAPTIANPTFTGNVSVSNLVVTDMAQTGPTVTTGTAITGNVINVTKAMNVLTVSADTTFTFSGTPTDSGQWFSALISNSSGTQKTLTIPSSYSLARGVAVTTVILPASGQVHLTWMYTGAGYNLYGDSNAFTGLADVWVIPLGDETTALTTGTSKVTFRAPRAATVTGVRASLTTVSSSGTPTFDINKNGTSILSTKLTVDASEKTSTTAATAAVISTSSVADDDEITIDIDTAGTGAAGAKVAIYVTY